MESTLASALDGVPHETPVLHRAVDILGQAMAAIPDHRLRRGRAASAPGFACAIRARTILGRRSASRVSRAASRRRWRLRPVVEST